MIKIFNLFISPSWTYSNTYDRLVNQLDNAPYFNYSKWINNEIDIAKNEFSSPKKILAVEGWGSERMSSVVKISADMVVKWNTQSIIDAIRKLW